MMNYCAIQQSSVYVAYTDMGREYVVCPKPRRAGTFKSAAKTPGWRMSHQADIYDVDIRNELLDIILSKGDDLDSELTYELMPSTTTTPFFCGSPPSRVSNPLIQDARFVEEEHNASITCSNNLKHPTIQILNSDLSSTQSFRKSGLASATIGSKPAVRVEGFKPL